MARQNSGGQSRGGSTARGGRTGSGGTRSTSARESGTGSGSRGASARGSNTGSGTTSDAGSQNSAPSSDRQRDLDVSREGDLQPESRTESRVQGGTRGGLQTRAGQQPGALGGRNQTQPSVLPALMANPWLMTNAFLTNPYGFAQALNQEMDRLFASPFGDVAPGGRTGAGDAQTGRGLVPSTGQWNRAMGQWAPQIEVRQRGNELSVCADLPGMKPDDVTIEIDDGVLTISGQREQTSEDRQEHFYRSERSYGSFARSIALPEGVDENEVQARFENGVLEVTVPLPEQRQRGRKIEIQAGTAGGSADQPGAAQSK